jgi:hypothetical protein
MLNVYLTVDTEIWCQGWNDLDRKFPENFQAYVYGHTPRGDFGLPYQAKMLRDHGLVGVFFVEPLFSARFGAQPLQEMVGVLVEGGQEVQLHLHTEWADETNPPLIPGLATKRPNVRDFSAEEQTKLIGLGARLLREAGAPAPNAFRAGNFGFNRDTLKALAANGITIDSSYNALLYGPDSGVMPGVMLMAPVICEGVCEYPMTVFRDGMGKLRHTQLTAVSSREMEGLLWQALERGMEDFIILSHNFELLNRARNSPDDIVVKRFRKMCEFLDKHRDSFRVCGFKEASVKSVAQQPEMLVAPLWHTGGRIIEQAYRRKYG